jgi:hypothetical protein
VADYERRLSKLAGPQALIGERTIFEIVSGWFENDVFEHLEADSEWSPGEPRYNRLKAWYDEKSAEYARG